MSKKKIVAIILFLFLSLFMFTFANPKDPELVDPDDDKPVKVIDDKDDNENTEKDNKDNNSDYSNYINDIYGIGNGYEDSFEDKNNNGVDDKDEKHYTVTFNAGDHGKLNGSIETIVIKNILDGTEIEIPEVTPEEGYGFKAWYPEVSSKVTADAEYTATYYEDKNNNGEDDETEELLTLEFKAGENGTLEGETTLEILQGLSLSKQEVSVPTPVPTESENTKYVFRGWSVASSEKLLTSEEVLELSFEENTTLTALFGIDKNGDGVADEDEELLTLEFKAGENGTLEGETTFEVLHGLALSKQEVIVPNPVPTEAETEDTKYVFRGWSLDGSEELLTSEEVLELSLEENTTLTALFGIDKNGDGVADEDEELLTLEFKAGENGTLEGETTFEVLHGLALSKQEVVVPNPVPTETEDVTYMFKGWSKDGSEELLTSEEVLGLSLEENTTLTAVFEIDNRITLTFVTDGDGKITDEDESGKYEMKVESGVKLSEQNIELPALEANSGFKFFGWYIEGNEVLLSDEDVLNLSFDSDTEIKANFTEILVDVYTVTFKLGDFGTVNGSSEDIKIENVESETTVSVPEVTVDDAYLLLGWKVNSGEEIVSSEDVETIQITEDTVFEAVYNDKPVINAQASLYETAKKVKVEASVTDRNEITSVTIDGQDMTKIDDKYVFDATENKTYTIVAKDIYGAETSYSLEVTQMPSSFQDIQESIVLDIFEELKALGNLVLFTDRAGSATLICSDGSHSFEMRNIALSSKKAIVLDMKAIELNTGDNSCVLKFVDNSGKVYMSNSNINLTYILGVPSRTFSVLD